jgi:predicted ATP-binding protein involved in virulence
MRIESLELKNIGVFDFEKIEFQANSKKNKDKAEIHIFTGPNGSGKTTILYALAAAFEMFSKEEYHSNLYYKRFRFFEEEVSSNLPLSNFEKRELQVKSYSLVKTENGSKTATIGCPECNGIHSRHVKTKNEPLLDYKRLNATKQKPQQALNFAAFSYSGYRFIKTVSIDAIREMPDNPLYNALEFVKEDEYSKRFNINQWIANNISINALQQMNKGKQPNSKKNTVVLLSEIISEVVGYNISFELETSPINLVVKTNNEVSDFDVLPDGLRSMISWMADLLMRLDMLKWENDIPIFERNIILFLDEIEVHLHPSWQRKILPIIQKLFKNAQIFLTTHSPFIVNSVDGAWIHELALNKDRTSQIEENFQSKTSDSIDYVLKKAFNIDEEFGLKTQDLLDEFYQLRDAVLENDASKEKELLKQSKKLLKLKDTEITDIVEFELRQLAKITKNNIYTQ